MGSPSFDEFGSEDRGSGRELEWGDQKEGIVALWTWRQSGNGRQRSDNDYQNTHIINVYVQNWSTTRGCNPMHRDRSGGLRFTAEADRPR
jgi:hypothetical protein